MYSEREINQIEVTVHSQYIHKHIQRVITLMN